MGSKLSVFPTGSIAYEFDVGTGTTTLPLSKLAPGKTPFTEKSATSNEAGRWEESMTWQIAVVIVVILWGSAVVSGWFAYASRKKTLKLNELVGYRTDIIMTNQETWQEAHAAAWPWTAAATACLVFSGFAVLLPLSDGVIATIIILSMVVLLACVFAGAHRAQKVAKEILAASADEAGAPVPASK
ncbi:MULTISPECIES: SdpI family protein [Actinotignum]|nr:SdpI family protein [Actinotignum timonense]MBS5749306.1 SdpI family protein [Actinotignum schaalii]MDK8356932.1 SdpI family protein [Actinotignum timonense]